MGIKIRDDYAYTELDKSLQREDVDNFRIKIRDIKCPRLLEEQWKYEKILLDYNIIDFTSKKI